MKTSPPPKPVALPRPSVREQIAGGPTFGSDGITTGRCLACQAIGTLDAKTGLCRELGCWQAWRWSAVRERELPEGC